MDFEKKPIWEGTGLLFFIALATIVLVTLLTPPESKETLLGFYKRCRPPLGWKKFRRMYPHLGYTEQSVKNQVINSLLGIIACFGLAMATNAVFIRNWLVVIMGILSALGFGALLIKRTLGDEFTKSNSDS